MRGFLLLAMFLAAPFWETKDPSDWTVAEAQQLITSSPWVQSDGVAIMLVSAKPMQAAEALLRKKKPRGDAPDDTDYEDFLEDSKGKYLVVAVPLPVNALANAREARRMEEESVLKVGKKKYKMTGHFAPTPGDPFLRMVFPKDGIVKGVKSFVLELYLPIAPDPYREAEFALEDLMWKGKLEL